MVSHTRTDDLHGFFTVLLLGPFFLHLYLDIGWQVDNTNGCCNLVDVLSTRTRCVVDIDPKIFWINVVLDFFDFWHDQNCGSRCMDTTLAFSHRNALYPVGTRFILEFRVDRLTRNHGHYFFDPANAIVRGFHDLKAPTLAFRIFLIHLQEVASKQLGFVSSCCPTDFQDNVLVIVWIFWKK